MFIFRSMEKPYIHKIDQIGDITVYLVDGSWIRTNQDEEFTDFGQHYRFKYIPKMEFWIDQKGATKQEIRYFTDHMLVEHRLMAKGMPYAKALEKADVVEKRERKKDPELKSNTGKRVDGSSAHISIIKHIPDGVTIWLVNGEIVRDRYRTDFTEGGHDKVYKFVPPGEVWIEKMVIPAERPYIILHELHERVDMAKGMKYDEAHARASRIEYHCRHHPSDLRKELSKLGYYED